MTTDPGAAAAAEGDAVAGLEAELERVSRETGHSEPDHWLRLVDGRVLPSWGAIPTQVDDGDRITRVAEAYEGKSR